MDMMTAKAIPSYPYLESQKTSNSSKKLAHGLFVICVGYALEAGIKTFWWGSINVTFLI